jgi:probable HAF family extracellular repeat protein
MSARRMTFFAVAALCGLFAAPVPAAHATIARYRTVNLGIQGAAAAINDRGQVVGSGTFGMKTHPFLFDRGRTINLGVLHTGASEYGTATDINNRGQVVGGSITADGGEDSPEHAFLWEHGRMIDLGTLGGSFSRATSINERGQVVGFSDTGTAGAGLRGFLWENGTMIDLGMRMAFDINNRGQVVGTGILGSAEEQACLWQNGKLIDLDIGPVSWSDARAVNDRGWITGDTPAIVPAHAFLWRSGTLTDLGSLGGDNISALDVNERGQILGVSSGHAFIWERGRMIDLTPYGMPEFPDINSFNNGGQIAGSTYVDGTGYATVFVR